MSRTPSSRSVRPAPSSASFASTATTTSSRSTSHSLSHSNSHSLSVVRTLNFTASVPIEFSVSGGTDIDRLYLQVARIAYLPLVLATVRTHLLELCVTDPVLDEHVWFQDADSGRVLKPHWPIGLLYDHAHAHARARPANSAPSPWRVIVHFDPTDPAPSSSSISSSPDHGGPVAECRNSFFARWKEGDYVRFGSSKKRLVNLRKEEQDALWHGVVTNDFDQFWSVANKLIPPPPPPPPPLSTPSLVNPRGGGGDTTLPHNGLSQLAPNSSGGAPSDLKNLAIRVYLPPSPPPPPSSVTSGGGGGEGGDGMILTLPGAPFTPTGQPTTLGSYLSNVLPLLFPPLGTTMTPTTPTPTTTTRTTTTACAIVQGIQVPLDSELSWLASCMTAMDGWVNVVVVAIE